MGTDSQGALGQRCTLGVKPIVVNEMSPNLNQAAKTAERRVEKALSGHFFTASSAAIPHHLF